METIPIRTELKAQLNEYATRHGQDIVSALDSVLTQSLLWERMDFDQALAGIEQGCKDMEAGRTEPAASALDRLAVTHNLAS